MISKFTKFTLLTGAALLFGAASSAQAQCSSGVPIYSAPIVNYAPEYYAPPQHYVPQSTCGQAPVYQYHQPVQQVYQPTYTHQPHVVRQPTVYVPHHRPAPSRSHSHASRHHH